MVGNQPVASSRACSVAHRSKGEWPDSVRLGPRLLEPHRSMCPSVSRISTTAWEVHRPDEWQTRATLCAPPLHPWRPAPHRIAQRPQALGRATSWTLSRRNGSGPRKPCQQRNRDRSSSSSQLLQKHSIDQRARRIKVAARLTNDGQAQRSRPAFMTGFPQLRATLRRPCSTSRPAACDLSSVQSRDAPTACRTALRHQLPDVTSRTSGLRQSTKYGEWLVAII